MIIKSSTALRNNYGMISDLAHDEAEPIYITKNGEGDLVVMSIEAFEQREEALKLRAKLEAAEAARLSGAPTYTLEESRKRITCRPASHAGLHVCVCIISAPSGALTLRPPVPASAPWNRAASGHFSAPARTETLPAPVPAPALPAVT